MTLFLTLGVDGRPERVLALITETAFEVIERQSPRHYSSIPILRDVLYLKKIKIKLTDQQTFHSLTHILSLHPSTHLLTHPPSHHPLTNTPTLHPLTYSPINPLIHSPTHSLFHPPIHPLTRPLTHPLIHSLTDSHSPLTHQVNQLTCESINKLMNKSRIK